MEIRFGAMQLDRQAFVLTRGWRDTPQGIALTFWLLTDEGPVRLVLDAQEAVMFVEQNNAPPPAPALAPPPTPAHGPVTATPAPEELADRRRPLELRTLHGAPVEALYFRSRRRAMEARDALHRQGRAVYESDVKPSERYLMERFITGGCRLRGQGVQRAGYVSMRKARLARSDYRPALRVASIDIETDGLDGPLLSIALVSGRYEHCFMIGEPPPDAATPRLPGAPPPTTASRDPNASRNPDTPGDPDAPGPNASDEASETIHYVRDERALLQAFFAEIKRLDPDALIGWNVVEFDLRYLQARCERLGLRLMLGRAGERARVLLPQRPGQLPLARVPGRVVLDGIGLLKSATYSFERYSLEHVAQALLGHGKAIDTPDDRIDEIRRMFREDKPALARYNLQDCRLVADIFARADLLSFAIERQRMTGLPLDRVGGAVAAFDNLYLPRLHRAGFVAADVGAGASTDGSPGGYVLASQPGLYDNVLVLDFKSLYPSIIRTFRVDPLGLAQPGDDPIEGFGGARFAREDHILPGLIEQLWADREQAKKRKDAPLSRAIKIIMNSFYGVLGTPGCRFYSHLLASSITRRGHEIMTRSRDWIVEQGHRVIYGDTDSLFVLVGPKQDADGCLAIGRDLARRLNAWWQARVQQEHRVDSCLEIEFEVHYQRFFMPTLRGSEVGSAKRYAGWVREPEPHVVVKGLEAVRTDWTPLARRFQRELLRRAFCNEPVEAYVRGVRKQLLAGQLDDELIYRKRLRRQLDDYTRNVPPHVRAARMLGKPVREVSYVWTARGPEPIQKRSAPLDYHHYLHRQLAPAADGLLHCLGTSFERVAGDQVSLF